MIWLSYVALTVFLASLLVVSFARFHRKNGHKYRRRTPTTTAAVSPTTLKTT